MPCLHHRHLLAATWLAAAAVAHAEPQRCDDAVHREFDFWIGHWEVLDPQGERVGDNRITAARDGCSLYESWQGRGGVVGNSVNRHDKASGHWRQVWIDNQGGHLDLRGARQGPAMVLEGEDSEGPARKRHRISWTPQPDGSVRQLWQSSADDGRSWQTAFDGRYVRRKP